MENLCFWLFNFYFWQMKIVITSATKFEVRPLKELVKSKDWQNIRFHDAGVGILQSTFSIQKMMWAEKPDFIIQVGIAGTFDLNCILGDVVLVEEEFLGSCGVEENGEWLDIFNLNLLQPNYAPFQKTGLKNPFTEKYNLLQLPAIKAITIDEISTNKERIDKLKNKYECKIESMEGAALHYCGLQYQIPFLQIRGVSNYVGERNKQNWKIDEAINNACQKVFKLLGILSQVEL